MRDPHRTTIIEGNCPDPEHKTVLVTELCGYYTRHLYGFFIFFFPLPRDLILNKTTTKRKISSRLPYLISRALILFFFFFYTHRGYVSYVRILLLYTSYFSINDTLVSFKKKKSRATTTRRRKGFHVYYYCVIKNIARWDSTDRRRFTPRRIPPNASSTKGTLPFFFVSLKFEILVSVIAERKRCRQSDY